LAICSALFRCLFRFDAFQKLQSLVDALVEVLQGELKLLHRFAQCLRVHFLQRFTEFLQCFLKFLVVDLRISSGSFPSFAASPGYHLAFLHIVQQA
jgi:hypothetical protein